MHGTIGLKNSTATLALPPEIAPAAASAAQNLPRFKPRWWYRKDRLDARPVIWSLYNHPEEWDTVRPNGNRALRPYSYFQHKPSNHYFRIWAGECHLLEQTECGCQSATRGRFQVFQKSGLRKAAQWWENYYKHPLPALNPQHFAGHFIHQ